MNFLIPIVLLGFIIFGGFFYFDRAPEDSPDNNEVSLQEEQVNEVQRPNVSKTLDLSGKGLTKVPNDVFERNDIEELDISNNNLEGALQAEVRHLSKLRILDLSDNNFTGVPAEVGQLSNLEILDLSNNQLTGLPYEIGNLSSLKLLDLSGNNYSEADLSVIKQKLPQGVVIRTK